MSISIEMIDENSIQLKIKNELYKISNISNNKNIFISLD